MILGGLLAIYINFFFLYETPRVEILIVLKNMVRHDYASTFQCQEHNRAYLMEVE